MPDISAQELEAYVDGELDLDRQLAVEAHLAQSPIAAARVMEEKKLQTALRLANRAPVDMPAELSQMAAQLGERLDGLAYKPRSLFGLSRLTPRRFVTGAIAAGVVASLVPLTLPHVAAASPPEYVSDAVMAFHTGMLRASMVSQHEIPVFDRRDVQRNTGIRVPVLPDGWQVADVQLVPSDDGPALQIMVRTKDQRTVSIFAVRNKADAPARPISIRRGAASVAYWRNGDIAYALTGMEGTAALDLAAEDLADNRLD